MQTAARDLPQALRPGVVDDPHPLAEADRSHTKHTVGEVVVSSHAMVGHAS